MVDSHLVYDATEGVLGAGQTDAGGKLLFPVSVRCRKHRLVSTYLGVLATETHVGYSKKWPAQMAGPLFPNTRN